LQFSYAIAKREIGTLCTLNQNLFNSKMALEVTLYTSDFGLPHLSRFRVAKIGGD